MSTLSSVLNPIETAQGLPNDCYVNPEMHIREADELFGAGWAAIGFGIDVEKPGCVYPVEFMGRPLLLTRTAEGAVKVFENVCRHRGMILVDEPKRLAGPITCPYHAWAYSLDGELKKTPHIGGPNIHNDDRVNCSELSLNEIRSAVWRDVVFVNLSGTGPDFDEFIAPLKQRWQEFEKPIYWGGADSLFSLDVKCNWKLAVENYCEAYHLPFIHPGLNSYSRLEDHYNILEDDSFAGQGTLVYNPQISDDGRSFPSYQGIDKKWDTAAEYCALFPNVLLGVHKDHSFAIVLLPKGQERTEERVSLYYTDPGVSEDSYADMRKVNARMWKDIFIEDIGVVEGMQRGRHAAGYDGGKFSPVMDNPTHHFHKWVASALS